MVGGRKPLYSAGKQFPVGTGTLRQVNKPLDRRALVWFRRDLRVDDHAALYHALQAARQVWCVFIFDRAILDPLPRADRRVEFILASLVVLDAELRARRRCGWGGGLIVRHGDAADEIPPWPPLGVQAVFANHDDDPPALARDARVRGALADRGVALHTSRTMSSSSATRCYPGRPPFTVFTPYKTRLADKLDAST